MADQGMAGTLELLRKKKEQKEPVVDALKALEVYNPERPARMFPPSKSPRRLSSRKFPSKENSVKNSLIGMIEKFFNGDANLGFKLKDALICFLVLVLIGCLVFKSLSPSDAQQAVRVLDLSKESGAGVLMTGDPNPLAHYNLVNRQNAAITVIGNISKNILDGIFGQKTFGFKAKKSVKKSKKVAKKSAKKSAKKH
jgi:hypothetical protein